VLNLTRYYGICFGVSLFLNPCLYEGFLGQISVVAEIRRRYSQIWLFQSMKVENFKDLPIIFLLLLSTCWIEWLAIQAKIKSSK